jgi:hypothetical protein
MKYFSILLTAALLSLTQLFAQSPPPSDITGSELRTWLKTNWYDGYHNELGYDAAREAMYGYIDERSDGEVYCVYTGFHQTATHTTYLDPINCEHSVPQSFFGSNEPMRSDIHHLYPTHGSVNSARSNHPFGNVADENATSWYIVNSTNTGIDILSSIPGSDLEKHSKLLSSTKFEPRDDHKGDVARAVFYFYTMYPTQAGSISSAGNIDVLYEWHLNDPPDAREIQRNDRTEEKQGNRNPYIDYPEILCKAWNIQCASGLRFTSDPITEIQENESYNYYITAESNEAGASMTITAPVLADWMSFEQIANDAATLTGSPTSADVGEHDVSLQVSDGTGIANQHFTVTVTQAGLVTIFEKDFEDQSLTSGGWTEQSITGPQIWQVSDANQGYNSSYSGKINGYDNGAVENEDWLISPAFNPNEYESLQLSFWNTSGYDGPQLQAYYLSNYSDDVTSATQTEISGINWHDGVTNWQWVYSGEIDLSYLSESSINIAFKFTSTNTQSATWEIDDIKLSGQSTVSNEDIQSSDIQLYPNPANEVIYLNKTSSLSEIIIYNITGQKMYARTVSGSKLTIDVSSFTSGIYFMQIQKEQGLRQTLKFIVQ